MSNAPADRKRSTNFLYPIFLLLFTCWAHNVAANVTNFHEELWLQPRYSSIAGEHFVPTVSYNFTQSITQNPVVGFLATTPFEEFPQGTTYYGYEGYEHVYPRFAYVARDNWSAYQVPNDYSAWTDFLFDLINRQLISPSYFQGLLLNPGAFEYYFGTGDDYINAYFLSDRNGGHDPDSQYYNPIEFGEDVNRQLNFLNAYPASNFVALDSEYSLHTVEVVPVPGAVILLGSALLGMFAVRRRSPA